MTAAERSVIAAMSPEQKRTLAVKWRNSLWRTRQDLAEDDRIARLNSICTDLCLGDCAAGLKLALDAIYS